MRIEGRKENEERVPLSQAGPVHFPLHKQIPRKHVPCPEHVPPPGHFGGSSTSFLLVCWDCGIVG